MIDGVDRHEPANARLYFTLSRILSRLCGRNTAVLKHTCALMERARRQSPNESEYLTEHGAQLSMTMSSQETMELTRNNEAIF